MAEQLQLAALWLLARREQCEAAEIEFSSQ